MSRTRRSVLIAAAWAMPIAWFAVALLSGPTDGTTVSDPTSALGDDAWSSSVTVLHAYGDTPLHEGDTVLEIGGHDVDAWVTGAVEASRTAGDSVTYHVRRPARDLNRDIDVAVPLTGYPVTDAVTRNGAALAVAAMLLGAASFAFWHRPRSPAAGAFLAGAATVPFLLTSTPFGVGAIDLAGSRGVWPQLVGELVCAVGLGALLLSAVALAAPAGWLRRHAWAVALVFAIPLAGYAGWLLAFAVGRDAGAARLQAVTTVVAPALVTTFPVIVAVLLAGYLRAREREDRLALRLVLLAVVGGVAVRALFIDLPARLGDGPLVPWELLALLLVPAVLTCFVVALLRYHLDDIEPTVRRALVQALVATIVGAVFVGVAGAVNITSDVSFDAMVAGGVVALLLLPVAVALQRVVRRLVYGDREFPHRIVSELRALDPLTAPSDVLEETLRLLARRLRLSWAEIEVFAASPADRIETSIGEPRGRPTTIDLVAGGASLGRLRLEVDLARDPFGPGDRRLLEDVGSQVGALVQAVSINRDLRQSRQDLVAAREEERRRVRRDLHDGLGPSLATLAMRLDAARDLIAEHPEQAAALVAQLSEQARDEIAEVRRLVDGLRPPALDQFGLVSALRQRAEEHNVAAAAGHDAALTWSLDASEDLEPLPAAVEVAAYRIVVEAVTNAIRHSEAETCSVTLRRTPDCLHIEVRDTGVGLPVEPVLGIGLASMRERAAELGGRLSVTSAPGEGTLVEADLALTARTPQESVR